MRGSTPALELRFARQAVATGGVAPDAWPSSFARARPASAEKGHTALFWFGIIFPVLWIVGALMVPTPAVAAAESRKRLQ